MQTKISVVLVKSRGPVETADINKMSVHLEQVLAEKDRVDLKIRQTLTDTSIKSAKFVVFCGYDTQALSDLFKVLHAAETGGADSLSKVFLYDEPGQNLLTKLNELLTRGMDAQRVSPTLFNKLAECWNYRDIIGYIDAEIRQLGTAETSQNSTELSRPE